jgi:thiamine-phosphate pyrophosphorylase
MRRRQTFPLLWLLTDARNDTALERTLRRLPRGSALVFRHYHLGPVERRERFERLARIARSRGHLVFVAGSARTAAQWGAEGVYASPDRLGRAGDLLRVTTAHSLRELAAAGRAGADAVFLSPVFPTRSHPGAETLGPLHFRLMADHSRVPVIALGGMNALAARRLGWPRWGAIDGTAKR